MTIERQITAVQSGKGNLGHETTCRHSESTRVEVLSFSMQQLRLLAKGSLCTTDARHSHSVLCAQLALELHVSLDLELQAACDSLVPQLSHAVVVTRMVMCHATGKTRWYMRTLKS